MHRATDGYTNNVRKSAINVRGPYSKWSRKHLHRSYAPDRPCAERDLIVTVNLLSPQNKPCHNRFMSDGWGSWKVRV